MHSEEYHHKTDARKVKRCESILEEAISELIARKEREGGASSSTRWRKRGSKNQKVQMSLNESELRKKAASLEAAMMGAEPTSREDPVLSLLLVLSEIAQQERPQSDLASQAETWEEFQSLNQEIAAQQVREAIREESPLPPLVKDQNQLTRSLLDWAQRVVIQVLDQQSLL